MKTTILAGCVLAFLALPATAQQGGHQGHHGNHGQMRNQMQGQMPGNPQGGPQGGPQAGQHGGHHGQMHGQHGQHGQPAANEPASTKAFREANDKMHKEMDIRFSGDADIDFIRGMIPHHQGAIDMARVVLAHGKDPETRKLAEEIIAAQEKEITFMRDWLKKKGQ